jgi:hypothetical protein
VSELTCYKQICAQIYHDYKYEGSKKVKRVKQAKRDRGVGTKCSVN